MNNLKPLCLSIFLIGLFLFSIPKTCNADTGVSLFLLNYPPFFIIIAFMGVWIIEALTIRDKLIGKSKKAFFIALLVNLITSLLGFLINYLDTKYSILSDINHPFIIFISASLFISIVIETIILRFCYRQENWAKIISTGFLMNLKSYLFLLIFFIGELMTFGGIIVLAVIVPYFFLKSFELLSPAKKISIPTIFLIIILSLIVFSLIFMETTKKIGAMPRGGRDSRIISAMAQLRTQAELSNEEYGSYRMVGCSMSTETPDLCNDISKQLGATAPTDWPTFATSTINSDNYCAYARLRTQFGGQQDYYCITRTMGCNSIDANTVCVPGATPLVGCGCR